MNHVWAHQVPLPRAGWWKDAWSIIAHLEDECVAMVSATTHWPHCFVVLTGHSMGVRENASLGAADCRTRQ